jgi:hypothetical protein
MSFELYFKIFLGAEKKLNKSVNGWSFYHLVRQSFLIVKESFDCDAW